MSKIKQNNQFPSGTSYALKAYLVNDNISHLLGKVLTVIDASTEGDKNKAIKDLLRKTFEETQNWIWEMGCHKKDPTTPKLEWYDGLVEIKSEIHQSTTSK